MYTTITLLLTGCGGSSGEKSSHSGEEDIAMATNQPYTVYPGDQVIKDSNITRVKITHTDGLEESSVELIEGSAILRKN